MIVNVQKIKEKKVAYTHAGVFHTDDVFSGALLRYINPDIIIRRVCEAPNENDELIFDIGGGYYDHHQPNAERRGDINDRIVYKINKDFGDESITDWTDEYWIGANDESVPYAAFGLLWRDLGPEVMGDKKSAIAIDRDFIIPLDNADNNGIGNPLTLVISSCNPQWDSDENFDNAYEKAVKIAGDMLTKIINKYSAKARGKKYISEHINKKIDKIAVLDRFVPWQSLIGSSVLFVIYPSNRAGGWNIQLVPQTNKRMVTVDENFDKRLQMFYDLPSKWLNYKEITSAPEGIEFIHKSLFMAVFHTREQAINAANELLDGKWGDIYKKLSDNIQTFLDNNM